MTVWLLSLQRPLELARTLESIGGTFPRCVILNGAELESYREVVDAHRDQVSFVHNPVNIGVAAAFNQAIVLADSRYVLLSGDDLTYQQGWADQLSRCLSRDRPLQVSLSEPIQFSSFVVDKALMPLQGWFDHNFTRIYYEDEDWKLRTKERLRLYNDPDAYQKALLRLGLVQRPRHRRVPWNSIPNRVYFWRKWERLSAATEDCLYLRPNIIVRRRQPEPVWPTLERIARRYAEGDFGAQPFSYDRPSWGIRALTRATTNRPVIAFRRVIQQLTNPDQELR